MLLLCHVMTLTGVLHHVHIGMACAWNYDTLTATKGGCLPEVASLVQARKL